MDDLISIETFIIIPFLIIYLYLLKVLRNVLSEIARSVIIIGSASLD
jgi:hypothetical protein